MIYIINFNLLKNKKWNLKEGQKVSNKNNSISNKCIKVSNK